jgi:hypothetical protein
MERKAYLKKRVLYHEEIIRVLKEEIRKMEIEEEHKKQGVKQTDLIDLIEEIKGEK